MRCVRGLRTAQPSCQDTGVPEALPIRIGVLHDFPQGDDLFVRTLRFGLATGAALRCRVGSQRFDEAVGILEHLGASIVEVDCPSFEYALGAYYLILPSEASSNLARFDGMRYGLRVGDDGEHSVEQVMQQADSALYQAKRQGRNQGGGAQGGQKGEEGR